MKDIGKRMFFISIRKKLISTVVLKTSKTIHKYIMQSEQSHIRI